MPLMTFSALLSSSLPARAAIAAAAALVLPVCFFSFHFRKYARRKLSQKEVIKEEFLRLPGPSALLAFYDNTFNLRECASLLPDGGTLPIHSAVLRSDASFPNSSQILLFGGCACFASCYPNAAVTLTVPPPDIILTDDIRRRLLKSYAENDQLELQAEARGIPCAFLR